MIESLQSLYQAITVVRRGDIFGILLLRLESAVDVYLGLWPKHDRIFAEPVSSYNRRQPMETSSEYCFFSLKGLLMSV
jgi:hypothetical protein